MSDGPDADFDPVFKIGRYVLGEAQNFFGIWDRRSHQGPIEQFPLTEEGYEAAEARLREVAWGVRIDGARRLLPRILIMGVIGGAVAWVAGAILTALVSPLQVFTAEPGLSIISIGFVIEGIGFRVMIGAFLAVGGVVLITSATGVTSGEETEPALASQSRMLLRLVKGLAWTAMTGLVVWIAVAAATQWLLREESGFFGLSPEEPTRAFMLWSFVESLVFRIWVAAVFSLGLLWARDRLVTTRTRRLAGSA